MKKNALPICLFVGASFVVTSCVTLPTPYSNIGTIDYSPLTKNGIYVTESNSVNFEYIAVSSIIATEKGGWVNGSEKRPSIEVAFKNIIEEMKKLNANGIINLGILASSEMVFDGYSKGFVPVITVKGMAIRTSSNKVKREDIIDSTYSKKEIVGNINGVDCWIIQKHGNDVRMSTSKKLSIDQIRKAKQQFSLKEKAMFYMQGSEDKNEAYAGIDGEYIILYETNEFIKLNESAK